MSAPNRNNVFVIEKFSSFFFCVRKKMNRYFNTFFYAAHIVSGSFSNQVFLLILGALTILFPLKMQAHVSGKPDFYWERLEIISTHWQFLKTCQNGYFLGGVLTSPVNVSLNRFMVETQGPSPKNKQKNARRNLHEVNSRIRCLGINCFEIKLFFYRDKCVNTFKNRIELLEMPHFLLD